MITVTLVTKNMVVLNADTRLETSKFGRYLQSALEKKGLLTAQQIISNSRGHS